jgi:hypothetical protein
VNGRLVAAARRDAVSPMCDRKGVFGWVFKVLPPEHIVAQTHRDRHSAEDSIRPLRYERSRRGAHDGARGD